MAWSSITNLDLASGVGGTEYYPGDEGSQGSKGQGAITLNPGEACELQVRVDFQATPTEGLIVNVYTTLDDSAETWDNQPYQSFLVPHNNPTADPKAMTVIISGPYKFCLGYQTGGTDTHTFVYAKYRKDGISA